ncbi:hypothetical protein VULLAG_LOCUS5796 [Vulpes lagopus]
MTYSFITETAAELGMLRRLLRHGLAAQTGTWNQPPELLVPTVSTSTRPWV